MNALRRFSHKCPNLLQPIAYKYKPFPYYITEPVENRRLIGYLLKHRAAQRWLDSSVATFLADRDTVTRDITAYNMIVDTEDNVYSARGSPSGFLTTTCHVKLADLGLAHEFRNNNALYHDTEIRPDPDLDAALGLEDMYPSLSPDQVKRKHVPETGVPAGLQALIDAGKRSELYSNTRKSAWISYGSGVVTDEELYTSDWMKITHRGDSTVVEELVPRTFTQEIKPSLEANELPGIPWLSDKIIQTQGQHVHVEREYPLSVDLQTAARKGWLWETHHDQREEREEDVYDQPDGPRGPKYLVSFASLARSVACLNEQGSHIQSGPDPAAESGELQDETPVLFRRKKKRTKLPRPARYIREKLRARTQKTKSKRKVTVDTSYNPHLTEEETTLKTVEPPSSDNLCAVREGPYAEYKPEDLHASIYQDLCQPSPEKAAKMEEGGPENFEPEARQAAQDASEETRGSGHNSGVEEISEDDSDDADPSLELYSRVGKRGNAF
nr:hypothetical protein BaRGS_022519 [Batillaria attramentaria]